MVHLAHVQTMGNNLMPTLNHRLQKCRIAAGDDAIDGETGLQSLFAEQFENAENADAIAVVTVRVIAKIRIGHRQCTGALNGLDGISSGKCCTCVTMDSAMRAPFGQTIGAR